MTPLRIRLAYLVMISLVAMCYQAAADEYVWARTNWGNGGGPNRPVGAMGNGYGGYYVPRNGYGNNYEGRRFTNPNGYNIPTQTPARSQAAHRSWSRLWTHWR